MSAIIGSNSGNSFNPLSPYAEGPHAASAPSEAEIERDRKKGAQREIFTLAREIFVRRGGVPLVVLLEAEDFLIAAREKFADT